MKKVFALLCCATLICQAKHVVTLADLTDDLKKKVLNPADPSIDLTINVKRGESGIYENKITDFINDLRGSKPVDLTLNLPESIVSIDDKFLAANKSDSSFMSYNETFVPIRSVIVSGRGLKVIGKSFLRHRPKLEKISLPQSIEIIDSAFLRYCENLKAIQLPSNLKIMGDEFLLGCKNITNITIPKSVTSIGQKLLLSGEKLSQVNFLSPIKIIPDIFLNLTNIDKFTIPSTVQTIGMGFLGTSAKLKSIIVPSSVTEIKDAFLSICPELKTVVIPDSVKKIGSNFLFASSNVESVTLPGSIESIGDMFLGLHVFSFAGIPDKKFRLNINFKKAKESYFACSLAQKALPKSERAKLLKLGKKYAVYYNGIKTEPKDLLAKHNITLKLEMPYNVQLYINR
jgi:hypothetical protein